RPWLPAFFFSSRRRHTRSKRDWSSDVCSSDLPDIMTARTEAHHRLNLYVATPYCLPTNPDRCGFCLFPSEVYQRRSQLDSYLSRSEERRVGKECRSRRAAERETAKEDIRISHI